MTCATALLDTSPKAQWLLANRGYDAGWFREALSDKGIKPCVPGSKSRNKAVKYDKRRYKRRNRVEIMFGLLKDWRRVAWQGARPRSPERNGQGLQSTSPKIACSKSQCTDGAQFLLLSEFAVHTEYHTPQEGIQSATYLQLLHRSGLPASAHEDAGDCDVRGQLIQLTYGKCTRCNTRRTREAVMPTSRTCAACSAATCSGQDRCLLWSGHRHHAL